MFALILSFPFEILCALVLKALPNLCSRHWLCGFSPNSCVTPAWAMMAMPRTCYRCHLQAGRAQLRFTWPSLTRGRTRLRKLCSLAGCRHRLSNVRLQAAARRCANHGRPLPRNLQLRLRACLSCGNECSARLSNTAAGSLQLASLTQ